MVKQGRGKSSLHSMKLWSEGAKVAFGVDTLMSLLDLVIMRSRV